MKKFIFEEKFISFATVEIYAENEEDARLQFQNGNYQYYDISDFTDSQGELDKWEQDQIVKNNIGVWEADDEDDLIEEITTAIGWCIKSIDYDIQLK